MELKILKIENCHCSCLMFKNEEFFIFGEEYKSYNEYGSYYLSIWNKNGTKIKDIKKLNECYTRINFIEATYFENKNYILLSGCDYEYDSQQKNKKNKKTIYCSKCYNYDEDDIKIYKCDDNNSQIYCINLFKKGNDIYFITGSNQKVNIFEFESKI